jgi:hypothetical protein
VKSALTMMKDLPGLFDLIYELMPDAYNKSGGKFGKIDGVGMGKYKTRFFKRPRGHSYGESFMHPLVFGLTALMRLKNGQVTWVTDPEKFVKQLPSILKSYNSLINGMNFDFLNAWCNHRVTTAEFSV